MADNNNLDIGIRLSVSGEHNFRKLDKDLKGLASSLSKHNDFVQQLKQAHPSLTKGSEKLAKAWRDKAKAGEDVNKQAKDLVGNLKQMVVQLDDNTKKSKTFYREFARSLGQVASLAKGVNLHLIEQKKHVEGVASAHAKVIDATQKTKRAKIEANARITDSEKKLQAAILRTAVIEDRNEVKRSELQEARIRQDAIDRRQRERFDRADQNKRERDAREQDKAEKRRQRDQFNFQRAMTAQRFALAEKERANEAKLAQQMFRFRMAMTMQRAAEDEERRAIGRRAGRRSLTRANNSYNALRSAGTDAVQVSRAATVLGGAGIAGGIGIIGARMGVDTAETNLKMFGGDIGNPFTQEDVKKARAGWVDQLAIESGMAVAGTLNAFTEVLKSGVSRDHAEEVTKMVVQGAAGMDMPLKETSRVVGKLMSMDRYNSPAAASKVMNAMAIAAAESAADPHELVEGMGRGFGALQMGNMSAEDLAALVSGGISSGIHPGKSGTFVAALSRELAAARFLKGQKGADMSKAANLLGFGNKTGLSAAFQKDSTGTILQIFDRLNKMTPDKRLEASFKLLGRMWSDEELQVAGVSGKVKEILAKQKDPASSNFLPETYLKRMNSWRGRLLQAKAVMNRFWEAAGMAFDEVYTGALEFFRDHGLKMDFSKVTQHVEGFLQGVLGGLNIGKTWKEAFANIFGTPGSFNMKDFAAKMKAFGEGFGEGMRSVYETIVPFVKFFAGGDDAKSLGKFTSQFILFGAALLAISPFLPVLTMIVSVFKGLGALAMSLGGAALMLKSFSAGGGLLGGAAGWLARLALGGSLVVTLGAIAGGVWLGVKILEWIGAADWFKNLIKEPVDSDKRKGDLREKLRGPEWLDPKPTPENEDRKNNLRERLRGPSWLDPKPTRESEDSKNKIRRLFGLPEKQSSLGDDISRSMRGMRDSLGSMGAMYQLAAISGGDGFRSGTHSFSSGRGGSLPSNGGSFPIPGIPGRVRLGPGPLSGLNPGSRLPGMGPGIMRGGGGGVDGPIAPFKGSKTFDGMAPRIMGDLQRDFGLSKEDAAAILGNLGHESGGFRHMQELRPLIPGSRGGWGWAQWTGPRRRAFEAWAAARGLDQSSYEANYGFLRHELQTTHRRALEQTKRAQGLSEKTRVFEQLYEGAHPNHKGYASREKYAKRAMDLPDSSPPNIGGKGEQVAQLPVPQSWNPARLAGDPKSYAISPKWSPDMLGWKKPSDFQNHMPWNSGSAAAIVNQMPPQQSAPTPQTGQQVMRKTNAPITVYAGNQDPEALANTIHRRIHEAGNWQLNDVEHA